ncbi:MAG TPA: sigma-70 family RNA polymerase sigma factor [Candidatus Binatia bacterium]|nr:sigma-70 family RNA polymerase sigma factor [Candidatus Binatia bacterium]
MAGERKAESAEREAFAREAMVHLDHLYRIGFHLAKHPDEAQELVQETFVRALAACDQFSPGTNMKAWLTKIMHNLFFDRYHQKKRWISTDDTAYDESDYRRGLPVENPGPESLALSRELNTQIADVLTRIPEEFRAAIVLVDMGDFTYEEAAEILSCPIGTIRSRLSRGRKLLQECLGPYVGSEGEKAKAK